MIAQRVTHDSCHTVHVLCEKLCGKPSWTQYSMLHEHMTAMSCLPLNEKWQPTATSSPEAVATACNPAFLSATAPCKDTSTACAKLKLKLLPTDGITVSGRVILALCNARVFASKVAES